MVRATLRTRWYPRAVRSPRPSRRSRTALASVVKGACLSMRCGGSMAFGVPCRSVARRRASVTRRAMDDDGSPGSPEIIPDIAGLARLMRMSNRSRSGPLNRRMYLCLICGVHVHDVTISFAHGHGLLAPISRNRAGNVTEPRARATRTSPSSSGWRRESSSDGANSPISSRNNTP